MTETGMKALIGRGALLLASFLWGSSFVVVKGSLESLSPMWLPAIRCGLASLLLLVICARRLKAIDRQYLRGGLLMGLFLSAACLLQVYGLVYTTPGKSAFLTSSYCVMVPFLAWRLRGKRPDAYNVGAAFICLAGIAFVSLGRELSAEVGDLLTVLGGFFLALHLIVTDRYIGGRDPLLLTAVQTVTAAAVMLCAAALVEPLPDLGELPASLWLRLAYLSAVCSAACYLLQIFGQKYTPPTATAVIMALESIFGTAVSLLFYGERLSVGMAAGFLLIFVSVIVSETKLSFLRAPSARLRRERG
ncbi:MAG: DMT family transporter [Synergistaceae bacterium]|nr:DMT family transporter [Synergistaceae bacterium]